MTKLRRTRLPGAALCFALSLAMLAALFAAGGGRPYTSAPAGFHYGINSPLDVLCLLLPPSDRLWGMQLLLLLRAAGAGTAMCWYLERHAGRSRLMAALGAAYAAGVYTACIINVIWVDAAIFLPLMMNAADLVMDGGKGRRLAVTAFFCVLTNCYTSWPLCLFLLLYLAWQWFCRSGKADLPGFGRALARLIRAMLPGILAALCCLMPVLLHQYHSDAFRFSEAARNAAFPLESLIYCLFFGRYTLASATVGLPYLYVGVLVLAAAVLYFFGGASTRAKFVSAFALVVILASYLVEAPGICWSDGADVAVFPFRYGFIFSAMLLVLAADTITADCPPPSSAVAFLLFMGIVLLDYRENARSAFTPMRLAVNLLACPVSWGCLWLRRTRPARHRLTGAIWAGLLLAELYAGSCITLYGVLKLP
ncbi:MAG: YfhO family protein [Gemmiger sp.]